MVILRQAVRFGLVGVVNTGTYLACYLALRLVLPYLAAHVLAFAISTVGSFFLNCWFTYRVSPTWKRFLLFPLTTATNFVLTTAGVYVLVEWIGMDERPAPLVAAAAAIPVTFLVSRTILAPKDEPTSKPTPAWEIVTAAVLATGVYLGTLVVRNVYPAGTNSILTHDLSHQYAPLFSYLRQAVLGPEGLMFSWQADLGMNLFPLAAYYLASPFNAIALLVGDSNLPEAIIAVTAGKLALAAATMAWYLRRTFPGPRPFVVAAAVTYSAMSWAIFNASNLMWLDALYLLPLVLLAIERLLASQSMLPLAGLTAATMIVNYYAGMMTMLFAGLYLVVRYVALHHTLQTRAALTTAARATAAVAIGLLCAGVVIIPSLRAIQDRYAAPEGNSDVPLPWADFLGSLYGGTMLDKLNGPPHLAVGTATLVFALVFFAAKRIPRRERVGFGLLLAFLIASCQVPFLYLLWHGFEPPTSYPHRFGFVLSFLLVLLGYRAAVTGIGRVAATAAVGVAGAALATAAWVAGVRPALLPERVLLWTAVVVTAAATIGLAYFLFRGRERIRRPLVAALAILLILDASGAAALASKKLVVVDRELWSRPGPAWSAELRAANPQQDEFFRADATSYRTPNDALRFGNFAITHYSSITNGRAHRAFHALGFSDPLPNVRFDYQGSTLVTDAMFGFRTVLSDRPLTRPGFELVRHVPAERPSPYQEPLFAYRNANALPVGYFFEPGGPLDSKNPFTNQESLLGDDNLFTDSCQKDPVVTGGTVRERPGAIVLTRDPAVKSATLRWTCHATSTRQLYLWHQAPFDASDVRIDDEPTITYPTRQATGPLDLGQRTDTTFTIEFSTRSKRVALPQPLVQGLDVARFDRWVSGLRARSATAVRWTSAGLAVEVDDAKGGRFFLSVPHISGWQAEVDGRPAPIRTTAGAFIGLDLEPGRHRIELAFRPPGLRAGLLMSSVGAAGLIMLVAVPVLRRHRRDNETTLSRVSSRKELSSHH
ncbi:GtrA family protein [Tenggerimyces flavus]|uniref:YfhO family protein n=1 Tax=Tenggerimyces flavus TaxID=1708749 RepID=A0ABV7YK90_9ACTN|nr:GtrA family protein [Tenggerimyces flavus]MBM7789828.1 putative membrane protein YfhO/putative flippase GtrA [Tenggerimyces flavus]